MSDPILTAMRDLIQEDIGNRGLKTDPAENLVSAFPHDFEAACQSVAETPQPAVAVVTGFFIPHAQPPAGETDGPLGALFLARALSPIGIRVVIATDAFCARAVHVGLQACQLDKHVRLVVLPDFATASQRGSTGYFQDFLEAAGPLTHLIALERVGPSHSLASLRAQGVPTTSTEEQFREEAPAEHHDRCHTMRGRDITTFMSPAHWLLEEAARQSPCLTTIGIGDGGNEIGMGKIPWSVIRRNIPGGGLVACRVPADHLVVCGVSNWGAYALAAGVRRLRGAPKDPALFDLERERDLLRVMVEQGPLVDGVTGQPAISVDGLDFERYAEPLRKLGTMS